MSLSSTVPAVNNISNANIVTPPTNKIPSSILSSPDILKGISRNLTPPIPPTSNKAVAENQPSSLSVPISDPLIDVNWPGRPKRTNTSSSSPPFSSVDEDTKMNDGNNVAIVPPRRQRRQISSPTFKKTAIVSAESDKNGNIVKGTHYMSDTPGGNHHSHVPYQIQNV